MATFPSKTDPASMPRLSREPPAPSPVPGTTAPSTRSTRHPIAEPVATERDLWRIWERRRLPVQLSTRDGRALRVLFPGVPNTGAGPDFTGAHIALDQQLPIRGDVELHLHATSWEGHGHHRDQHYDSVVLHVVLLDDGGPTRTSGGKSVPLLALGPLLADLGAGDATAFPGPCHQPDLPRPLLPDLHLRLRRGGEERFEARVHFWQAELHARPLEDVVLQALLRTAGLGRNTDACAALATALDGRILEDILSSAGALAPLTAEAVILGMAGLLPAAKAGDDLWQAWRSYRGFWPGTSLDSRQWQRFRLHPANRPEARLALIAALIAQHGLRGFLDHAGSPLRAGAPFRTAACTEVLTAGRHAAGRAWALEAWANILLPMLHAYGQTAGPSALAEQAVAAYAELPGGGQNTVLARMTRIAGLSTVPRLAIEQQGLLQLWSTHCSHQRCATCPLAGP
jgi:hypothetical protein